MDTAKKQGNFYLTFYFVCSSLSDPQVDPFGGWADRIFTVLRYLCILLIASQFILSMGNRPQGQAYTVIKKTYGVERDCYSR